MKHDKDVHITDEHGHTRDRDTNPDPITGAPGSHPIGTGVGAAGAGAVGAAIGAVAGPVGSLAGAAIGAVVGGLAGKGVAEAIDPTAEEAYWRENYSKRPYIESGRTYDDYHPAYRLGWESRAKHHDRKFEDVEHDLGRDWDTHRGTSGLEWHQARHASRDAWDRVGTQSSGTGVTDRGAAGISDRGLAAAGTGIGVPDMSSRGGRFENDFDSDSFRRDYTDRPYYEAGTPYDEYEPAYQYGHSLRGRHAGRRFDEIEEDARRDWDTNRGRSSLSWDRAKHAVRDAYERMSDKLERAMPGDSDRDRK